MLCLQLTLEYALDIFLQLIHGLAHVHACGVLHRDLKSENVLVQSLDPLVVKLADFGSSVQLFSGGEASLHSSYLSLSSPMAWRAPETFLGDPNDTTIWAAPCDVFMLGCTLVEVLTACERKPFDWLDDAAALAAFRSDEVTGTQGLLLV